MAKLQGQGLIMEDTWIVIADIEKEHGVHVGISLHRKTRKGVWGIRARVYTVVDGKPHRCIVERFEEWPNSRVMSLEALLFQLAHELSGRTMEAIAVLRDQAQF